MKQNTLEQAYIAREQMKDQAKGLTESSRAALSAVSGRNILKTKKETEKIKRDQEIAAQQAAASIAMAQADQGISLEKNKVSIAQQKDHAVRDDTFKLLDGGVAFPSFANAMTGLATADELKKGSFAHQQQISATKRSQILSMMNVGIYDPNFAGELGLKDSVVREFADKKAKEIAAKRAKAAAKKRAEYQAALNKLQTSVSSTDISDKERQLSALDIEIAEKSKVMDSNTAGVALLNPQNEKIQKNLMRNIMDFQNAWLGITAKADPSKESAEVQQLKERREQLADEIESLKMKKNVQDAMIMAKDGSLGYAKSISEDDQIILAALGIEPEKAKGALVALKDKDTKYIATSIEVSRQKMKTATTEKERNDAAVSYTQKINSFVQEPQKKIKTIAESVVGTVEKAEPIGHDDYEALETAKVSVGNCLDLLKRLQVSADATDAEKTYFSGIINDLELKEKSIQAGIDYYERYEEFGGAIIYEDIVKEYESVSTNYILSAYNSLKKQLDEMEGKIPTTGDKINFLLGDESKKDVEAEGVGNVGSIQRARVYAKQLQRYYYERLADDNKAELYDALDGVPGANIYQKFANLQEVSLQTYIENDFSFGANASNKINLEGLRKNISTEDAFESPQNRVARSVGGFLANSQAQNSTEAKYEAEYQTQKAMVTALYLREVVAEAERMYPDATINDEFDTFLLREDGKINLGNLLVKESGNRHTYIGDYSRYKEDIGRFLRGDYGYFTEEQAKRILILQAQDKLMPNAGFDYYATLLEGVVQDEARDKNRFVRLVTGLQSDTVGYIIDQPYLMKNFMNQGYARVKTNPMTATHRANVEDLNKFDPVLGFFYEAAHTTVSMTPQVVLASVPVVGQALSLGYVGTKTMLQDYSAQIAAGMTPVYATNHSVISAIAEVGLERTLGVAGKGIGKIGANAMAKKIATKLTDHPAVQKILTKVLSFGSEGLEEALQVVIEPTIGKMAADIAGMNEYEIEDVDWGEAAKSFALAAISSGILDGMTVRSKTDNAQMKYSDAKRSVEDGSAMDIIREGAELGIKKAQEIKEAFLFGYDRYEGKTGLASFVSVEDVMDIGSDLLNARNAMIMASFDELLDDGEIDPRRKMELSKKIRRVLCGKKLKLTDVNDLVKNKTSKEILEALTGESLEGKSLSDIQAILRLAAFPTRGKTTIQQRIELFKNEFGELNMESLRQEIYYADLKDRNLAGVIVENAMRMEETTEADREQLSVLETIAEETGIKFLITDRLESGTWATVGMMAVNFKDIGPAMYEVIGREAYYAVQKEEKNAGGDLRGFIVKELERQLGKEAVTSEINKIRQQGAANGLDISDEAAKDELCARMMPEILLKNAEALAAENPELAKVVYEALKGTSQSIHKMGMQKVYQDYVSEKPNAEIIGLVHEVKANDAKDNDKVKLSSLPADVIDRIKTLTDIDVDGFKTEVEARQIKHILVRHGEKGKHDRSMAVDDDIAKMEYTLMYPDSIIESGTTEAYTNMINGKNRLAKTVLFEKKIGEKSYYVDLAVPNTKRKTLFVISAFVGKSGYKKTASQLTDANSPSATPKDGSATTVNNSISDFFKNVNTDFTREVVDRLAAALNPYRLAMNAQIDRQGVQRMEEKIVDELLSDDEFKYTSSEQVAEENGGADFSKTFDNMTPDEREATAQQMGKDLDELMTEVAAEQRRAEEESTDKQEALRRAEEMTGHSPEKEKRSLGEWVHDVKTAAQYQLTDTGTVVHEIGKEIGDRSLYDSFNMARSAEQAGMMQILEKQTDIFGRETGKGLKEIWAPIMKQGEAYQAAFDNYLLYWHNIDRMSRRNREAIEEARGTVEFYRAQLSPAYKKLSEQELRIYVKDDPKLYHIDPTEYQATYNDVLLAMAEDFQTAKEYVEALDRFNALDRMYNKPVFGWDVDADASRMAIKVLEAEHPEFKQYAEDVWQFARNLNKNRVDSGLITAELSQQLQEVYPHYVPVVYADGFDTDSKRSVEETAEDLGKEGSGKTVKRAKGGEGRILTIRSQLASQAMSVAREGAINRFGEKLIQAHDENGSLKYVKRIEKREDLSATTETFDLHLDEQDPFAKSDGKKMFSVFLRGVRYDIEVDDRLFAAIESLRPDPRENDPFHRIGQINIILFKKMITAYNPLFTLRNFKKDMGDAAFTSQSTLRWSKNLPKALYQIIRNGEQYRQYKALGGGYTSITGVDKVFDENGTKNPIKWLGAKMEVINQAVEQLPRFAEYLATVEKGNGTLDSLMEAIYNADDITTNFGRAGNLGKKLNRYAIPFFNPAIQGMSKAVRLVTEQPGFKSYLRLAIKAAAIGFAPILINGLLFGDDEEWEEINQRDKDLYFLWKISDGCWLKIPKGRLASVVGMTGDRIRQAFSGEDVEWAEFLWTAAEQVAPSNPLTSNIAGPFLLTWFNSTWWGGEIENERLRQYAPGERYDTKTDELSKWIGSWSGLSPKKINYLLDAYSGVFGDILLPWMSPAAEQGFLEKAFTIDTHYSNRLTGDFYERLDELTWAKNKTDATKVDEVVYRWWSKNSGELSAINKEIRSIEENEEYSASDKEEKVDAQYVARNVALLNFEESYDRYVAAAEKIAKERPDLDADDLYRETNREVFGAEAAILTYNKEVHARAAKENKENGISFDDFYDIYFDESVDTTYALNMMAEGFVKEDSVEISAALEALEPKAGKETVSYVQKIEAILNTNVSEYEKMRAMAFFGNDTEKRRLAIAFEHGVDAKDYLAVKMNIETIGETKNAAIQAAIDNEKNLDKEHRAILWQLLTGSTSAKNNPYSVKIGNQILEEIDAYKKANE